MPTTTIIISTVSSTVKDGTSSSISRMQEKVQRHNPEEEAVRVATIPFLYRRLTTTLRLQTEATNLGQGLGYHFRHSSFHSGWTSWNSGMTPSEHSGWSKASKTSLRGSSSAWSAQAVLGRVVVRFPHALYVGKAY